MCLFGYSLSKAYLVLGTQICWKSLNVIHFDITWRKNSTLNSSCTFILQIYNQDIKGFNQKQVNRKQLIGTGTAAKLEQVP